MLYCLFHLIERIRTKKVVFFRAISVSVEHKHTLTVCSCHNLQHKLNLMRVTLRIAKQTEKFNENCQRTHQR